MSWEGIVRCAGIARGVLLKRERRRGLWGLVGSQEIHRKFDKVGCSCRCEQKREGGGRIEHIRNYDRTTHTGKRPPHVFQFGGE